MFGYIRPVAAELKVKEYELYRAVYCGLCAALGRNTTCVSRLSLSYDFVFLAIVRMALSGESGKIERRRCVAHPTKKRGVLTDASQLDYCARLSSVLTYHKLRDDAMDSRGWKRAVAYMLMPYASFIRKRAKMDASAEEYIKGKLGEQIQLEKDGCSSIDRAAEPFGKLMAYVCSLDFAKDSPEARIADEIGRHIGRFIYIIDAVDDLGDDIKSDSYNPFRMMYEEPIAELSNSHHTLKNALTMELMGIEAAVELIDFSTVPEYGEIIRNIIYLALPALITKVLNKYSAESAEDGEKSNDRSV